MKALVLSGGGSKGAYEVGALKYLMSDLKNTYDIFAGVSVGAINAAFLAQYGMLQPGVGIRNLEALWDGMDQSKVYRHWWLPYVAALWKPSLYDSSPMQKLVRAQISQQRIQNSGKKLRIGATGLDAGEYRIFDETYADIPAAVMASSAFPGMLTPVELEGQLWTDGGVKSTTPLKAAIDAGATSIDVVLCSPEGDASTAFATKTTALGVGVRAIALMSDQIEAADLQVCGMVNKLVTVGAAQPGQRVVELRIIRPISGLVKNPLDFTPTLLASMKAQGYADAKSQYGV
jgi:NTE family protein